MVQVGVLASVAIRRASCMTVAWLVAPTGPGPPWRSEDTERSGGPGGPSPSQRDDHDLDQQFGTAWLFLGSPRANDHGAPATSSFTAEINA